MSTMTLEKLLRTKEWRGAKVMGIELRECWETLEQAISGRAVPKVIEGIHLAEDVSRGMWRKYAGKGRSYKSCVQRRRILDHHHVVKHPNGHATAWIKVSAS
jgi:hypothetical protein